MSLKQDRNFDSLVERFEEKIYDTPKGDWRINLLQEDLLPLAQNPLPLGIWDAGCGLAQISCWLAKQGHQLTLCDISEKMLQRAQLQFEQAHLKAEFYQEAAQSLALKLPLFDLVLLHAVLEWLAEPLPALQAIVKPIKTGGYLSLMFYNRNAMIYTNALKGGWRWQHLLDNRYLGKGKRLTPPNPQYPHEVISKLEQLGFAIVKQTGIRVFHDYLTQEIRQQGDIDGLFELEYRFCRMPTYRDMGRYIHILARRTEGPES
jgi:S-adenosylmethionine-dependent methyltransferase